MTTVAVSTTLGASVAATGAAVLWARRGDRAVRVRLVEADGTGPAVAPAWFAAALARSEVRAAPDDAWPWARGGALVLLALLAALVPPLAFAVVVAAGASAASRRSRSRRRAQQAAVQELPAAIDALVAALAGGASLAQAVDLAALRPGVVGADLAVVAARRRQGTPLQAELDGWAARRPGTGVALVADALALAGGSGGSQARALEGVVATLREREALGREVRALGSQARLSALVLVVTPIGFAAVVAAIDARIRAFLLLTPPGWACLVLGLVLDVVGAAWMRRLTRWAS